MFDIGWSEMAIIALVALVVLGPKELPQAMKQFAQFSKKMRRYAQEFRAGVDNIVREAELEDAKKALDTVRSVNPKNAIKKMVDPTGEMTDAVKSVETAAKDGTGKTAATPAAVMRPLPPGEQPQPVSPAVDPAGPAMPVPMPAIPPAVPATAPVASEPAVAGEGARRVSTPLQIAPAHSIRPPVENKVVENKAAENKPATESKPVETAKTEPAKEEAPTGTDLRKQA